MSIEDPTVELRSTLLFQTLQQADPPAADRILQFVAEVAPVLATTIRHFPYYTRHDAHHGYNVVRRIEQVVKPDCLMPGKPISFKSAELFLLIAAAYAHDLGMTVFPGEDTMLLDSLGIEKSPGWETHPKLQVYLRTQHSRRGGKYIEENADTMGVPRPLVSPLDKMMQAHNWSIADLNKNLYVPYAANAEEIDVLQLAIFVCVADALEFSDTRVVSGVIDKIKLDPSEAALVSYQENMKHICVGESLAIREDGSVLVSGTFSEADVLALAHRTLDEMEKWIREYCDIDRRSRPSRLLVRPEPFTRNMDFTGGRFERLGVRLNKRNVIDLIASNAVWRDNKGIAIRELVQNAIEACRYRAYHSGAVDDYKPSVKVVFDRDSHSVTVSDNGCGMSEHTVLNNFLTVGSSRSREPGYAEGSYDPIARFGIGFWSVFTISEHAHVATAEFEHYRGHPTASQAAEGFDFDVSLEELKEYTVFRPMRRPCGTTIRLKLHQDVIIDDVYAQGVAAILCSTVPLTFTLDATEVSISSEVPDVSVKDVVGDRSRLMDDCGVQFFQWRGEANGTEVTLGVAYRLENGKATFLMNPSSSLSLYIGNFRYPKISVCGFITRSPLPQPCIDLSRVGNYFSNRKSPLGFEFTLDRQSLQSNQTLVEFSESMIDLVHEGYRAFLSKTNSKDAATLTALREQAAMHGGNVYDTFTSNELMDAARRYPDLLSVRLYPVSLNESFEEVTPLYVDLSDLRQLLGIVYFIQRRLQNELGMELQGYFSPESPEMLRLTYDIVRMRMFDGTIRQPAYVMTADRLGSMLFDANSESSVRFERVDKVGLLCIQFSDLSHLSFDAPPTNILAEVSGRWAGAVYVRQFTTPYGKPYLFLGRSRVLVANSSVLAIHIAQLAAKRKKLTISNLVTDLKEDEQGYTPPAIRHLL